MLLMFVYSVMGVSLFATVKIAEPLNVDIVNFQKFLNVFLILYRAICGENWHLIMDAIGRPRTLSFQCESDFNFSAYQETGVPGQCGNRAYAIFYFVSFTLVVKLTILNLFIAIILQRYVDLYNQ